MIVLALSGGNKAGLAIAGAVFIAFSLVSSFVLPRRDPNFPGRRLGAYLAVAAALFLAMMAAVLVFGREKEPTAEAKPPPTETTTPSEGGGGGGGGGGAQAPPGDPAAGKTVFTTVGCSSCHTLGAANATGNVGPNLDEAKPSVELITMRVNNGKGAMPPFKGQLSSKQIQDVVAFVYTSTHG
jgi:mono/diheme cytochrome c family protein